MQSRSRFWSAMGIAAVASVVFGLSGLLLLIETISTRNGTGDAGEAAGVVVAVVLLCASGACALTSIHLEHRLRGHPAGKIAADPLADVYKNAPPSWRTARRRRNGPVSAAVFGVIFLIIAVIATVASVNKHSQANLSGYVQAHGARRTAVVLGAQNIAHRNKSSTTYTAQITATLNPPVDGHLTTTVYVPSGVGYQPGDSITVLVDPRMPTYAELPGEPYVVASQWIGALIFAVAAAVAGCLLVFASVRTIIRRHAWRAMLPARAQPA